MRMKISLRKQGNNYENQPMEKRFCEKYKKNKIITYENVLNINNLVREFHTKILQLIEFENFIIIRIEYNSQISDNIFCINYENKIIWNISEIIKRNDEAYTGLNKISDNIIEVFLFIGICCRIDVVKRKIKRKQKMRINYKIRVMILKDY